MALEKQRTRRRDRIFAATVWVGATAAVIPFGWMIFELLQNGLGALSWSFLTSAPTDAGRGGGILPVMVSTAVILLVCLGVSIPIGVGAAAYLSEIARNGGRLARTIEGSLDLLAAVPSIVFGLFGAVFFAEILGLGFSILAGGLTLATMVLPIVIRSTQAGFRSAPDGLRFAAASLGLSKLTTLRRVLLPAAVPGLIVGLILGIGRALAETAALLFTSGYVTRMPTSFLDSGRSLSVHIYDLAMNVPGGEPHAYGTAVVLIALLVLVDSLAAWAAHAWLGEGNAR